MFEDTNKTKRQKVHIEGDKIMSYQEKKTLVSLVTTTLLFIAYCLYAFGKAGMAHLNDLQFWAKTILIFIGIGIVVMIVIQIVFHILMAIGKAIKQKMEDDVVDGDEIEKSIKVEIVEDEMDKMIELKANKIGYSLVGIGFAAGLIAVAFGASAVALLNILFLSSWLASFVEALVQIRYYRRGVR